MLLVIIFFMYPNEIYSSIYVCVCVCVYLNLYTFYTYHIFLLLASESGYIQFIYNFLNLNYAILLDRYIKIVTH